MKEDIGRKILNEMEYMGSFAEQIDNIEFPKVITQNKFSYANPNIGFYGRNIEQEEIGKFMSDDRQLLFWSITGRGGVGKSKLALHICKKYKHENWKTAWLNQGNVESINRVTHNNGYNKPLLLICDYAGEYIGSIKTLLLKLSNNNKFKIRLLLIERSGYNQASNNDYSTYLDTWYNRLLSGHDSDVIKEFEYNPDSLNLDNYILNDDDMFSILDDFSKKKLSLNDKKEIVDFVRNRLNDTSNKADGSRSEERCLFLLFTADAFLNGHNYSDWDTNQLMQQYVARFKNNLEAQYNENICKRAYILLAIASAIGTIDIERIDDISIFERNITPIKDELNYDVDVNKLKTFLSLLCEKDTTDLNVYPMYPDLVGEFFFIDTFNRISSKYKCEWYKIFCFEKYQNYFCSFLRRCLDDWYSLKIFKNIIKDLFEFAVAKGYKNFMEVCVNNYFFVGLSYYYTLTENDFVWIKDEILSKYDTNQIAEQYAMMFVNISAKMSKANDILKIANRIKDEVLSEYGTAKIAELYVITLVNATIKMSKADDILEIANRIKDEVLSEYDTAEIAEPYARALINVAVKMSKADDILNIANRIKDEVLSEYGTAEIALWYAMALVSASVKMSKADDILEIANKIKNEVLSEYGTAEIALRYAMALVNAAIKIFKADDIFEIANRIKCDILNEYDTAEIALRYAMALVNASAKMSKADDRLKIANRIRNEILSEYDTAEIALQYAMALVNVPTEMFKVDDILNIANRIKDEILSEYDTAEIALWYVMALVNASAKMSKADDRLKIANRIKVEILSEYGTAGIALQYAMALVNASAEMFKVDDILNIANRIKGEILSEYGTAEIALWYAMALVNASAKMSKANDRLKIANRINGEILSEHGTAEIALQYAIALANAAIEMSKADEMLDISYEIKNTLIEYDTKEIAQVYIILLEYIYKSHNEYEYLLEEIEAVKQKYSILSDDE